MARAAPPAMTPVPGRRRLQDDPPGAGVAEHRVGDRRARERDVEHVLAGLLDPLLDREAGLLRLAVAEADPAVAVTDHHERGERETAPTLHDLRDTVDLDRALFVLRLDHYSSNPASRAASASAATRPWYRDEPRSNTTFVTPCAFARLATSLPISAAAAMLPVAPAAHAGLEGRGGDQGAPGVVVDDLGDDVLVRAEHRQARPLGGADDPLADAAVAPVAQLVGSQCLAHGYFAAFPALRCTTSPA